jgi:hypothetical protein
MLSVTLSATAPSTVESMCASRRVSRALTQPSSPSKKRPQKWSAVPSCASTFGSFPLPWLWSPVAPLTIPPGPPLLPAAKHRLPCLHPVVSTAYSAVRCCFYCQPLPSPLPAAAKLPPGQSSPPPPASHCCLACVFPCFCNHLTCHTSLLPLPAICC